VLTTSPIFKPASIQVLEPSVPRGLRSQRLHGHAPAHQQRAPRIRIFSRARSTRWPSRAPARLPGKAPSATAARHRQHHVRRRAVIDEDGRGRGDADHEGAWRRPLRMGTPQNGSHGTLMIPPPSPISPEMAPATSDAPGARAGAIRRYTYGRAVLLQAAAQDGRVYGRPRMMLRPLRAQHISHAHGRERGPEDEEELRVVKHRTRPGAAAQAAADVATPGPWPRRMFTRPGRGSLWSWPWRCDHGD